MIAPNKCAICGAPSVYSGKYATCPECAFKIHKEAKTNFFDKYQDKLLEVLQKYGGDNFGGCHDEAFAKIKATYQKTMSKSKLNSSCCICGSPCHKFKTKYSTCVECALKVYQKDDPKLSKKDLKNQRKACEEVGGDGFFKGWDKFISAVIAEYVADSAPKKFFDCHTSETSVCRHGKKHIKAHDTTTQKNYLVKGIDGKKTWEEVRLCQHHFDTRDDKGWKGYEWQELTDKKLAIKDLEKGQRVEFEILMGDDIGYKGWATIIQGGKDTYAYWDLPNKTSWTAYFGAMVDCVKELGLNPEGKNVWICKDKQLKILRAFQPIDMPKATLAEEPVKFEELKIKLSDLKEGQRVQLRMTATGDKGLTGWAIVVKAGSQPIVYWEEKAPFGVWQANDSTSLAADALTKYGLDPAVQKCWHSYDYQVEVLQVGETLTPKSPSPALALKDFKEGQRLKITHRAGASYEHTTWATVVVQQDKSKFPDATLLYFDTPGGGSWRDLSGHPDANAAKITVEKLGLDIEAKNFRYCEPSDTIILEKAPEIKLGDLEVGSRIHVFLEKEKHYTWATVVHANSYNPIIHLDNPTKTKDGDNNATTGYDHVAREYGLPEGRYYWGVVPGGRTQILGKGKKLERIKNKPEEPKKESFDEFKVGDRIKVQHEGHTTWAFVVQAVNDFSPIPNSLLLYYDTPSSVSYPKNETEVVAACKTLGLDPNKSKFRRVKPNETVILDKSPPVKPKELEVGDRVYVAIGTKDPKHYTWATVISDVGSIVPNLHMDILVPPLHSGGSWISSSLDKVAESLGLSTGESNYWTAYSDTTKFLSKAGRYLPTSTPTKLSDCKEGERIKVEHMGTAVWATVVCPKGRDRSFKDAIVLAFHEHTDSLSCWKALKEMDGGNSIVPAAQRLGIDTNKPQFRRCYDSDSKVLERHVIPILKDLKQGDRVYVSIKDKVQTWATVIEGGNTVILHLDTKVNEGFGQSWSNSFYDTIASQYGIKTGEFNYWTAADTIVKVLNQGVSLPQLKEEIPNVASEADKNKEKEPMKTKYRVGEKLRIKIDYHDKELDAHVIQFDGEANILWLEDKSGLGWKSTNKKLIKTVQDLGLGRGGAMNCYFLDSDVKIVKRYDQTSEETKKGEENMSKRKWKVGDRVKIRTTSSYPFTGWGTIISLKGLDGDPNQPLLYMDEEQDDTWPWDEENQRKAAIKAGLDPEKASFWWLCEDDDTEVLEKEEEEKMEEKNFMGMVKSDMVDAGYRVAGKQMTKGVKAGLLKLFKDKGADDSKLRVIEEVLDSEVGLAAISLLLGYGAAYVPGIGQDPRFQRLSKEFRVEGFATAGNAVADTLLQYLAPAIMEGVSKLPPMGELVESAGEKTGIKKKTKKRIAPVVRVKDALKVEDQHEEEESKEKALAATT